MIPWWFGIKDLTVRLTLDGTDLVFECGVWQARWREGPLGSYRSVFPSGHIMSLLQVSFQRLTRMRRCIRTIDNYLQLHSVCTKMERSIKYVAMSNGFSCSVWVIDFHVVNGFDRGHVNH